MEAELDEMALDDMLEKVEKQSASRRLAKLVREKRHQAI